MARKGLCVGVNYGGTEYELRGCINDADNWAMFLADNSFDVSVLAEKQATRVLIMLSINRLVSTLRAGDIGFITFSGHGTWLPDTDDDEPDGRDEAIVPYDVGDDGQNLILDDELQELFGDLAKGATLIVLVDSCHSGSVFRFAPFVTKRKVRFLPPTHFVKNVVLAGRVDRAFTAVPRTKNNMASPGMVFYSGCRDIELAHDTEIDGKACGAFTYFAVQAFRDGVANGHTYRQIHSAIRSNLPNWEYQQTPQLAASNKLKIRKIFT